MPYKKLNVSGDGGDVLSWVTHEMSDDEHKMLRNVSRLPGNDLCLPSPLGVQLFRVHFGDKTKTQLTNTSVSY